MDLEAIGFSLPKASQGLITESLKPNKEGLVSDHSNLSTMDVSLGTAASFKSSTPESSKSASLIDSHSDISFHDDNTNNNIDAAGTNDDFHYVDDYEEDDNDMFDDDDDVDDDDLEYPSFHEQLYDNYLSLQEQFDNVNIPTGVEVSVPWLKGPEPTASSSTSQSFHTKFGAAKGSFSDINAISIANKHKEDEASRSSLVPSESNGGVNDKDDNSEYEIMKKFHQFKRFDTVHDMSDHHFNNASFELHGQPQKDWIKKIQEEWRILRDDLPDTIFVRVCEAKMNLLRAAIIGPSGTPYHDGIFFFDVLFPSSYPSGPPMVYYYSGGLRLNPNLYDCGKVCLSLLNTWNGRNTEVWLPQKSTMLQVLVSIQGLILNEEPFFNEPGHENMYKGSEGAKKSKEYNENVFILSLKTMLYTIRKPPKHFEDLITGHFWVRGNGILSACKAYIEGAKVGWGGGDLDVSKNDAGKSFKEDLRKMIKMLILIFVKNGFPLCDEIRLLKQQP